MDNNELTTVDTIECRRCGQEKQPHKTNRHLCDECVKAENNRVAYYRNHNFDWMEVSKEADLELWERQPAETDHEYRVWLTYRDAYPSKRPSYRGVAEQLGTTVNAIRKIASRWSFPARLQAWAKYVDDITLQQRREEIINMNKVHVDMATKLNSKLQRAINDIQPEQLTPNDLSKLLKLSTELERKARLDKPPESNVKLEDDNPELKKTDVKTENLGEIVDILSKSGVLGKNFGVRQTVTTEVVNKDDE